MLLAKEWSDFAHERKYLRVSAPAGKQRSTHYLSLPFRWAIPLLLASVLLHWLISQAIFLDRRIVIDVWQLEYVNNSVGSVSTVGYSPFAIILCLLVGIAMVGAIFANAFFKRYRP